MGYNLPAHRLKKPEPTNDSLQPIQPAVQELPEIPVPEPADPKPKRTRQPINATPFMMVLIFIRAFLISLFYTLVIVVLTNVPIQSTIVGGAPSGFLFFSEIVNAVWWLIFLLFSAYHIMEGWKTWQS